MVDEIERKWCIAEFPKDLELIEQLIVEQGYLSVDPEVRIRHVHEIGTEDCSSFDPYTLSIKGKGDLTRKEIEPALTKDQYLALVEMIGKPMIYKDYRRYKLPDGLVLECSLVDQGLESEFMYAEVEFSSEEEAKAFTLPLVSMEVTYNVNYKMKNYWKSTRLK